MATCMKAVLIWILRRYPYVLPQHAIQNIYPHEPLLSLCFKPRRAIRFRTLRSIVILVLFQSALLLLCVSLAWKRAGS